MSLSSRSSPFSRAAAVLVPVGAGAFALLLVSAAVVAVTAGVHP
ncbi:hypothetical protein [Leifsonia xyli]